MTDKLWRDHPAVRTGDDRTFGERAADVMRNGMGSWVFVFAFLAGMGLWVVLNSILKLGHPLSNGTAGFDPYPYILLNLMLSTLAGLQGAILLIAAKRADAISAQVAVHTAENTDRLLESNAQHAALLEMNTRLTEQNAALLEALTTAPAST